MLAVFILSPGSRGSKHRLCTFVFEGQGNNLFSNLQTIFPTTVFRPSSRNPVDIVKINMLWPSFLVAESPY